MIKMIKVATAECFTHGKIGREIHAICQNYEGNFNLDYLNDYASLDYSKISLSCSLFIPTLEALKKVLKVESPPEPLMLIKGIKVYNEEEDKKVAELMANSVKKLTNCDIAIGTTAGVGKGGIAIVTDNITIIATSDVYADLRDNNTEQIFKRQESAIKKTIKLFLLLLNEDFESIKSIKNVEIYEN